MQAVGFLLFAKSSLVLENNDYFPRIVPIILSIGEVIKVRWIIIISGSGYLTFPHRVKIYAFPPSYIVETKHL